MIRWRSRYSAVWENDGLVLNDERCGVGEGYVEVGRGGDVDGVWV